MDFINSLKAEYKPITTHFEIDFTSCPVETLWNHVKGGLSWEKLPEEETVFPEDVKDWSSLYNFLRGKKDWNLDMEAYMLICERKEKLLVFNEIPHDLLKRMYDLVPFILKGEKRLEWKVNKVPVLCTNNENLEYSTWTFSSYDCLEENMSFLMNGRLVHICQYKTGTYRGFGHLKKIEITDTDTKWGRSCSWKPL